MALNFIKESITIGADKITDKTFTFFKQGFRLNGAIGEPEYRDVTVSGVDILTLPNAKADGLNYCKLYGKCEQRNLPEEYTQVEYLQSSGTQYIDTGIKQQNGDEFGLVYQQITLDSSYRTLFGAAIGGPTGSFYISQTSSETFVSNTSNTNIPCDTNKHTLSWVTTSSSSQNIVVDGQTYVSAVQVTPNPNLKVKVFARNADQGKMIGKVYGYYQKRNGEYLINLIPARRNSDSVLGMYDTVTNTFLTNAGTGTFIAGNDVVPTPIRPLNIICNNGVIKVSPNLLNLGTTTNGYYYDSNGVLINHVDARLSNYIPIKANITYTVTTKVVGEGNLYVRYNLFNSSKTWLSQELSNISSSDGNFSKQITPTQDGYLRFSGNYQGIKYVDWQNAQVIKGSTPTTYMPYGRIYTDGTTETVQDSLNNTATAEMLLAVGNYKDVQSVIDGGVTRNVGIKVLDGTENLAFNTLSNVGYFYIAGKKYDGNTYTPLFCSHLKLNNVSYSNMGYGEIASTKDSEAINMKVSSNITSLDLFKQWLVDQYANGTPVIVVYQLATPTTSTVTGQTLTTKKGTNTIEITQASLTDLPIEVNYMAGVSVTVQQIENANLDNQVTVTIGE